MFDRGAAKKHFLTSLERMRNPLLTLPFLSLLLACGTSASTAQHDGRTVLPCDRVSLSASYLAMVPEPGSSSAGPGFDFVLRNDTDQPIKLAQPIPTSAHWYALVGGRWLWRASSGGGGSLVNALHERGPMFAYRATAPARQYLIVMPHEKHEWVASVQSNPALVYQPGCARCRNPGESEYRAIFAYAYLPAPAEQGGQLLACGLRSSPVVMPPHP